MVHPYILLSNKKKQNANRYNVNESKKHYADKKEPSTMSTSICFHLYEILEKVNLIYCDRKQISDCLRPRVWMKGGLQRDTRELVG